MPSKQQCLLGLTSKDSQRYRRQYALQKNKQQISHLPRGFLLLRRTILTALFARNFWKLDMLRAIKFPSEYIGDMMLRRPLPTSGPAMEGKLFRWRR